MIFAWDVLGSFGTAPQYLQILHVRDIIQPNPSWSSLENQSDDPHLRDGHSCDIYLLQFGCCWRTPLQQRAVVVFNDLLKVVFDELVAVTVTVTIPPPIVVVAITIVVPRISVGEVTEIISPPNVSIIWEVGLDTVVSDPEFEVILAVVPVTATIFPEEIVLARVGWDPLTITWEAVLNETVVNDPEFKVREVFCQ